MSDYIRAKLSVVDDVGFVYFAENKVFRVINKNYTFQVKDLLESGLIDDLVSKDLFPKTNLVNNFSEDCGILLEHELITPQVYPFEWSPEMLKMAALCVLEVNACAKNFGYELKDAHPYNVLFKNGKPVFIDFGSLCKVRNENSWVAYDEFISGFYYPLRLCEKGLIRLFKHIFLIRGDSAGKFELATIVHPLFSILGLSCTKFLLSSVAKIKRYFASRINSNLICKLIYMLILSPNRVSQPHVLSRKIRSIKFSSKSKWGSYHSDSGFYSPSGGIRLSPRMQWIRDKVMQLKPRTVIDLAGNQGVLSRELSKSQDFDWVLCADADDRAIDALALDLNSNEKITMACFDFMGEAWQALSGERSSRLQAELVLALAVTHHLILTQRYSIDQIFRTLVGYSSRFLILEFMPLGLWNGKIAPPVPDWYTESWFVENLKEFCEIVERCQLEPNRIVYVATVKTGL